ncbi:MAG: alpha/beta hydrolase, partial [Alphaproteobacteria bacterium]|nr:alpha/beta hydrolase [Alphaproteobacteria bacterium]
MSFVDSDAGPVEHRLVAAARPGAPTIVFLHEGL